MTRRHLFFLGVFLAICSAAHGQVARMLPGPITDARNAFLDAHPETGFSETGGLVERVWGRAFSSGTTPIESVQKFVDAHSGIWGVPPSQLAPIGPFDDGRHVVPIMYDHASDAFLFTGVYYSQQVSGIPVFRAHLMGLVRNEPGFPMVLASSTLRDVSALASTLAAAPPRGAPNPAIYTRYTLNQFRAPPVLTPAEWVIWAGIDDDIQPPRLAIRFEAEGGSHLDPANHMNMLYIVDASDGRILYQESLIYHADVSGTVQANVTPGTKADICAGVTPQPLPYARLTSAAGTHYANASGVFLIPWANASPLTVTSTIAGLYFAVSSASGGDLSVETVIPSGGSATILQNAANASEQTRAQVNAYLHANIARDWIMAANPAYPTIATQSNFPVNVNISATCNAYYSNSTINFYLSGGGCANTAFASVVHHEFGHNMVAKGGSGQGAYGEGMSDSLAVICTDESVLAYGFNSNCSVGIRNANNNCQYQLNGCSSCGSSVHSCGQLLSGCIWDLRNQFLAAYPADYRQRLAALTVNSVLLHVGSSSITPSITVDFLTLNDDNADITDGTPDYARINAAFSAHNMPAPPLSPIKFTYPSGIPTLASPNGTTSFPVHITALGSEPAPGTGMLFYRFGTSGPFSSKPLQQNSPNQYTVVLPAGACPGTIQFYIQSGIQGGGTATHPINAPTSVHSAPVAAAAFLIFQDDFETDKGWTYGVAGDTATSGFWERGNPIATIAQPGGGHQPQVSGPNCAFTGQHPGGGAGANDVDNGITTLLTPVFDASGADAATFTAWIWYSNDKGANPGVDVMPVHVSNNGGATWTLIQNLASTTSWVQYSWRLDHFVPLTNTMRLRFRAQDLDPQALIEAAVDTVSIQTYSCTPVTAGDLNGDGVVDSADLGQLLSQWGACAGCSGDLNGNGVVDGSDLGLLLANWS